MTATERVADLRARGITLTVARGRLRVHPASALRREDHVWLAAHWLEVVALLTPPVSPADAAPPPQNAAPPPQNAAVPVWTVLASTDPAAVGGTW